MIKWKINGPSTYPGTSLDHKHLIQCISIIINNIFKTSPLIMFYL